MRVGSLVRSSVLYILFLLKSIENYIELWLPECSPFIRFSLSDMVIENVLEGSFLTRKGRVLFASLNLLFCFDFILIKLTGIFITLVIFFDT